MTLIKLTPKPKKPHFFTARIQILKNKSAREKIFKSLYSIPFLSSYGLLCLMIFALFSGDYTELAELTHDFIFTYFSGFYSLTMNIYVITCLFLVLSPLGNVRLAKSQSERPEFSTLSWLAMLFSAGMGIGLLFYGVTEPLSHYNFTYKGQSPQVSLGLTIFHWGLHPWSCYAIVGLCFAYFSYRKALPFSIHSCLINILGKNKNKVVTRIIESATVICPIVGVSIGLGLGSMQIAKGIAFSFKINGDIYTQVFLIVIITSFSTYSVLSGLKKGMKYLSIINMIFAIFLLAFLIVKISPIDVFNNIKEDCFRYITDMPKHALNSASHDYRLEGNPINWTTLHWSAWIAWAPCVGMFIARISKGRTIRDFILGVVFVPTLLSIIWFSVLGNSSIEIFSNNTQDIVQLLKSDLGKVFFFYLSKYTDNFIIFAVAIISLKIFFITSSDSASLVIATAANEGKRPSKHSKIYWSIASSILAIIFLLSGGFGTMQLIVTLSAAPFAVISLLMLSCFLFDLSKSENKKL